MYTYKLTCCSTCTRTRTRRSKLRLNASCFSNNSQVLVQHKCLIYPGWTKWLFYSTNVRFLSLLVCFVCWFVCFVFFFLLWRFSSHMLCQYSISDWTLVFNVRAFYQEFQHGATALPLSFVHGCIFPLFFQWSTHRPVIYQFSTFSLFPKYNMNKYCTIHLWSCSLCEQSMHVCMIKWHSNLLIQVTRLICLFGGTILP